VSVGAIYEAASLGVPGTAVLGVREREAREAALWWYRAAGSQGVGVAHLWAGRLCERVGSYFEAYAHYQAAVEAKEGEAAFALGQLHEWGAGGVQPDLALAKRFYDQMVDLEPDAWPVAFLSLGLLGVHALASRLHRAASPDYGGVEFGGTRWEADTLLLLFLLSTLTLLLLIKKRRLSARLAHPPPL
jgi:TPR repeat protein